LVAVHYGDSLIVTKQNDAKDATDDPSPACANAAYSVQSVAPNVILGKRIPSVKVLSQADARPWHLHELLPSNGRWRVLVFPGDVTNDEQHRKLSQVASTFGDGDSFLQRFTPKGARYDQVFEVVAIHSAKRAQVTIFDFPEVFRQYDENDGWDYDKIFVDDVSYHEGHGKIYQEFGISADGCIIVVRPDQYVSYIGPLEDAATITSFFGNFMVDQSSANS
jgi:phenol 2-monooxygenase